MRKLECTSLCVAAVGILAWAAQISAAPLGLGFTYQGRLRHGGAGVNGTADLQFSLWDAANGGAQIGDAQTLSAVPVNEGLFAVEINAGGEFGPSAFNGQARWLQIAVAHPAGSGSYTTLSPRQGLPGTPHSLFALNADRLDGLNSSAFLQSIPVPLLLSGTNSSQIIRAQNASNAQDSAGIRGISTSSSGRTFGIYGVSDGPDGAGVRGQATSTADGASYGGYFKSAGPRGYGVYGVAESTGSGFTSGVYGISFSTKGTGVSGVALADSDSTIGVYGRSDSTVGRGVSGWATANSGANYGGYFQSESSTGTGVYGFAKATSGVTYGVYGESDSTSGTGVRGEALATTGAAYGGRFESDSTAGRGVFGVATAATGSTYGGYFESQSTNGYGLYGRNSATSGTIYGVRGYASTAASGFAVYAAGDMGASGVKPFRIDHPDDPANKYLLHYSVESPEVLNMYSGRVTLDGAGEAVVALPHYFAKINKDPRYSLTAVGAAMPMLHVAEEINLTAPSTGDEAAPAFVAPVCSFRIAGGVPGGKVSWEVKALRNDARMRIHGAPVERDKTGLERGKYQHPEYYGQPPEMSVDYDPEHERPSPPAVPDMPQQQ